ncbi:MAG: ATP-binding protein [Proteobacteria bacterium]|nr:ATP-binding protein [Pseudomonadota bacterium]
MKANILTWLCDTLALPTVVHHADGSLSINEPARVILGESPSGASLEATLGRLLGDGLSSEESRSLIARVRDGQPVAHRVGRPGSRVCLLGMPGERASGVWVVVAGESTARGLQGSTPDSELAAGVSHELANALGAIAGWAQLARKGTRVQEALEVIEDSATAACVTARHMLGGRAQREANSDPVSVSAVAGEAVRLMAPTAMRAKVKVQRDIEPDLFVSGLRSDLWSVIWNLLANAIEALPAAGTVWLTAHSDGDAVIIQVADNGPGMNQELRRQAFRPFFTTKESGSGLGLHLVQRAVETLGGTVELSSGMDQGTRVRVELPCATAPAQAPSKVERHSSGVFATDRPMASTRVLVVDDDPGTRELLSTALSIHGARVVTAANSQDALDAAGPFDVALIDLLLSDDDLPPDAPGQALLAKLRAQGKVNAALLISGTEPLDVPMPGGEANGYIRKPFQLDDLLDRVRETLDRHGKGQALSEGA